jgi:hypothetical protein
VDEITMASGTISAFGFGQRIWCAAAILVSAAGCGLSGNGDASAPASVPGAPTIASADASFTASADASFTPEAFPTGGGSTTAPPSGPIVTQFAPVERRDSTARVRFVHAGSEADGPLRVYWGSVPAPEALAAELQPGEASEAVAARVPAAEVENVVSWSLFPAAATSSSDAIAIADVTLDDGELVVWAIGAPPAGGRRRPIALLRSGGPDGFPTPFAEGDTLVYVIEPGVVTLGARDVVGYTDSETCLAPAGVDRGDVLIRKLEPGVRSLAAFGAGTVCVEPTSPGAFVDPSLSRRWVAVIGGTESDRRLVVVRI